MSPIDDSVAVLARPRRRRQKNNSMAFKGKPKNENKEHLNPEELYLSGDLPRKGDAVDSLWAHQGDAIRTYAELHQNTEDIALELPTGTAKTLTGLLIAEWVPALKPNITKGLADYLGTLEGSYHFQYLMIRDALATCLVYVSQWSIQIRPMVPPTYRNKIFEGSSQRLNLSATLGSGGDLERSFGRENILRIPHQTKIAARSGRRLFIFPDYIEEVDSKDLTRRIIALSKKAVVLSQRSLDMAEKFASELVDEDFPIYDRNDLNSDGLEEFCETSEGVLALANRYDGLDFPGESCRTIVLDGLASAVGLQENS